MILQLKELLCGFLDREIKGSGTRREIILRRDDGQLGASAVFARLECGCYRNKIRGRWGDMVLWLVADLVVAPEVTGMKLAFGLGVVCFLEDLIESAHDHPFFEGAFPKGRAYEGFAQCKPKLKGGAKTLIVGLGE